MKVKDLFRIVSLALCLLLLSSLPVWAASSLEDPQLVFMMDDPVEDDKGPGTYEYPKAPTFDPGKGLFDITKFKVYYDPLFYYFYISFGEMDNPWGAPEGFSHQRAQIYIDSTSGQGRTETFREGAYVVFHPDHGWEYLIDILSWNNTAVYHYNDDRNSKGRTEAVLTRLLDDGKTIQVRVPHEHLDSTPENWSYYVLIGGQDGFGPDNYRVVMEKKTDWQFGGGTDTYFDPNVIDLLAEENGQRSQAQQLGSFDFAKGIQAEIYPVVPQDEVKIYKPNIIGKISFKISQPLRDHLEKYPWEVYFPVYISTLVGGGLVTLLIVVNFRRRKKSNRRKDGDVPKHPQ